MKCDFCAAPCETGIIKNGYLVCYGCFTDHEEDRAEDAWASSAHADG